MPSIGEKKNTAEDYAAQTKNMLLFWLICCPSMGEAGGAAVFSVPERRLHAENIVSRLTVRVTPVSDVRRRLNHAGLAQIRQILPAQAQKATQDFFGVFPHLGGGAIGELG